MTTILFARKDSIYKTLPDCDVWDIDRNALNWQGGSPVIAHPPCRAWGRLRTFAKPRPGERDEYGGWSLWISQWWFGHRADKPTLLYIVGCEPEDVPPIPYKLGEATHVIQSRKRENHRPHVTKAEREHTPLALAEWLLATTLRVATTGQRGGRKTPEALARLHSGGSLNRSHAFTAEGRGSSLAPTGRRSFSEAEIIESTR